MVKPTKQIEKEKAGQFPSKNCECHWQKPYGFVPEADCLEHDTKQFIDFLNTQISEAKKQGSKRSLNKVQDIMYEFESLGEKEMFSILDEYVGETLHQFSKEK